MPGLHDAEKHEIQLKAPSCYEGQHCARCLHLWSASTSDYLCRLLQPFRSLQHGVPHLLTPQLRL